MADNRTYYEILGLKRGCTYGQIKAAYHRKAREFHPDAFSEPLRVASETGSERLISILQDKIRESEEEFKRINEANTVLSDPHTRRAYDRKLDDSTRERLTSELKSSEPPPTFDELMSLGDECSSQSNWDEAITHYTDAIEGWPDHPRIAEAFIKRGYAHWIPGRDIAADDLMQGVRRGRFMPWIEPEKRSEEDLESYEEDSKEEPDFDWPYTEPSSPFGRRKNRF